MHALITFILATSQVGHFNAAFLSSGVDPSLLKKRELLMGSILYECASQEKMDVLPLYLQVFHSIVWQLGRPGQPFAGKIPGLVTISILFCGLFTIQGLCKQVCFQKYHNQGLGQLFLTVSRDLCA